VNDSTDMIVLDQRFRVIAELQRGGAADVFVAVDDENRFVVIKRPGSNFADDPRFLEQFRNEARLAARLHHPNVVEVFEVIEDRGTPVMVMEFLEGVTLHDLVEAGETTKRPLTLRERVELIRETCLGLHYCHELCDFEGAPVGLVHRNISPEHVFVTPTAGAKLLDFSIAKIEGRDGGTKQGTLKGKLRYMAPEQMIGAKIDRRADIYAIGVMLWEASTGRALWGVEVADATLIRRSLDGDLPTTDPFVPSPELHDIAMRCLARKPEDRFDSCESLADALGSVLDELPMASEDLATFISELCAERMEWLRGLSSNDIERSSSSGPETINRWGNGTASFMATELGTPALGATPRSLSRDWVPSIVIGSIVLLGVWAFMRVPASQPDTVAAALPVASALPAPPPAAREEVVLIVPQWPSTAPTTAEADLVPVESPEPVLPAKIRVNIDVSPPSAIVQIDGVVILPPYDLEVVRDNGRHGITVSAPDYVSQMMQVTFDRNVHAAVRLQAAPEERRPRTRSARSRSAKPSRATQSEPAPNRQQTAVNNRVNADLMLSGPPVRRTPKGLIGVD